MIEKEIKKAEDAIVKYNLDGSERNREFVYRRFYIYKYLKENTYLSLSAIGRMVGKKHCDTIYGLKQFEKLRDDPEFYNKTMVLHEDFPLNLNYCNVIDVESLDLPYKTYKRIMKIHEKKKHKTIEETIIYLLINLT